MLMNIIQFYESSFPVRTHFPTGKSTIRVHNLQISIFTIRTAPCHCKTVQFNKHLIMWLGQIYFPHLIFTFAIEKTLLETSKYQKEAFEVILWYGRLFE